MSSNMGEGRRQGQRGVGVTATVAAGVESITMPVSISICTCGR